jgi:hypothetical protein
MIRYGACPRHYRAINNLLASACALQKRAPLRRALPAYISLMLSDALGGVKDKHYRQLRTSQGLTRQRCILLPVHRYNRTNC